MTLPASRSLSPVRLLLIATILVVAGSRSARANAILLSEGFDDIAALPGAGWSLLNQSSPIGSTGWFQGNAGVFPAQSGAADAYIAANFNGAAIGGDISEWLITPVLTLKDFDTLTFFTRSDEPSFNDRLEVRLSAAGAASNTGGTATSVGTFTNLLAAFDESDPLAAPYPPDWQQITLSISGLGGPTAARLAFRYVVSDTSVNGDYIGIDSVQVESVPEPSTLTLSTLGLLAAVRSYRQRRASRA